MALSSLYFLEKALEICLNAGGYEWHYAPIYPVAVL
jgi:hypothetical protein